VAGTEDDKDGTGAALVGMAVVGLGGDGSFIMEKSESSEAAAVNVSNKSCVIGRLLLVLLVLPRPVTLCDTARVRVLTASHSSSSSFRRADFDVRFGWIGMGAADADARVRGEGATLVGVEGVVALITRDRVLTALLPTSSAK